MTTLIFSKLNNINNCVKQLTRPNEHFKSIGLDDLLIYVFKVQ